MVDYSRSHFELSTPQQDGSSLRDNLEKAANGMFPNPEALAILNSQPAFPPLMAYLWELFFALHKRRDYTMDGPRRFAWIDIQSYRSVTGSQISAWELDVIFAVEDVFFEVYADRPK